MTRLTVTVTAGPGAALQVGYGPRANLNNFNSVKVTQPSGHAAAGIAGRDIQAVRVSGYLS